MFSHEAGIALDFIYKLLQSIVNLIYGEHEIAINDGTIFFKW